MEEKEEGEAYKMILETEDEIEAFDFICDLAGNFVSEEVCNDLNPRNQEKFKSLIICRNEEDSSVYDDSAKFDFDIIWWLKHQVKDKH